MLTFYLLISCEEEDPCGGVTMYWQVQQESADSMYF